RARPALLPAAPRPLFAAPRRPTLRENSSQAELRELARIARPVALHLDDDFQKNVRAEDFLELEARRRADLFERAPARANQHAFVRLAIDHHRRADSLQLALLVVFELVDPDGGGKRDLLAHFQKYFLA